jgi:hypothetical protein
VVTDRKVWKFYSDIFLDAKQYGGSCAHLRKTKGFHSGLLDYTNLKMEEVLSSETLVPTYQTTSHHSSLIIIITIIISDPALGWLQNKEKEF